MEYDVVELNVIGKYELWVKCSDGVCGTIRFCNSKFRNAFTDLADFNNFKNAYIDHGAVTWDINNKIIDLAPDRMHDELKTTHLWILE